MPYSERSYINANLMTNEQFIKKYGGESMDK